MTLISNLLLMGGARLAAVVSSALLGILTARVLGPEGRGTYALPLIDAGLAIAFAAGLSTTTSYFLLNQKAGRSIARSAAGATLLYTVVGAIFTTATAMLSHSRWAIAPAVAYIPLYAIYSMAFGYFVGRNRLRAAAALHFAMPFVTLILMATALHWLSPSPYIAIAVFLISTALVSCGAAIAVSRDLTTLEGGIIDTTAFFTFVVKSGGLNLMNLLNYRVDTYLVAVLAPLPVLGLYSVAVAGAESCLSLATALIQVTMPRIGSQTKADAALFAAKCIRNSLFLAGVLCTAGSLAAPPVVQFLFGRNFISIVPALRVLLIGVVVVPIGALISNYFMLNRGRMHVPLVTAAVSAALCGLLSYVLVPTVGMLGAAIGSTAGYLVSQLIAVACFCRETGLPVRTVLFLERSDAALYRRIVLRTIRAV